MRIEDNPPDAYMAPVQGQMIASTPATRRVRWFYFTFLWIPWSWFALTIASDNGITNLLVHAGLVGAAAVLSFLFGLYVEFQKRRADFGAAVHYYSEKLLVDPDLREHWNSVADQRCKAARVEAHEIHSEQPE